MIGQLLKYGNTFCAVEHSTDKDSTPQYYLLQLKKSKKELTSNLNEAFKTKDELFIKLKNQKHVYLIINNQQVLFKKVELSQTDPQQLVKQAFPSIKISDFYYEVLQNKEHQFVAICRKEYVDKLILDYSKHEVFVIGFSLFNLALQSLLPYLDLLEIDSSNANIIIENQIIKEINKNYAPEKNYSINNLEISNKHLLSLAGILSYYTNSTLNYNNSNDLQNELLKRYTNNRFYSVGLKAALGIVFFILLTNFLIFSNAHSKMNSLNSELLVNSSYKNTLIQLQNSVNKKSEIVTNLTSLSTSKTTWFINEIGKSVPETIQLSELKFQPLTSTIKENQEIIVSKNTILVSGTSKNNNSFSNWISNLQLEDWTQSVDVSSYGIGKQIVSSFEFLITIKD